MGWGRLYKGEQVSFQCYPVAWNFLQFMGIPVVEGRDFTQSDEQSENGVFIFNEAAKNKFGFTLNEKCRDTWMKVTPRSSVSAVISISPH